MTNIFKALLFITGPGVLGSAPNELNFDLFSIVANDPKLGATRVISAFRRKVPNSPLADQILEAEISYLRDPLNVPVWLHDHLWSLQERPSQADIEHLYSISDKRRDVNALSRIANIWFEYCITPLRGSSSSDPIPCELVRLGMEWFEVTSWSLTRAAAHGALLNTFLSSLGRPVTENLVLLLASRFTGTGNIAALHKIIGYHIPSSKWTVNDLANGVIQIWSPTVVPGWLHYILSSLGRAPTLEDAIQWSGQAAAQATLIQASGWYRVCIQLAQPCYFDMQTGVWAFDPRTAADYTEGLIVREINCLRSLPEERDDIPDFSQFNVDEEQQTAASSAGLLEVVPETENTLITDRLILEKLASGERQVAAILQAVPPTIATREAAIQRFHRLRSLRYVPEWLHIALQGNGASPPTLEFIEDMLQKNEIQDHESLSVLVRAEFWFKFCIAYSGPDGEPCREEPINTQKMTLSTVWEMSPGRFFEMIRSINWKFNVCLIWKRFQK